MDECDPDGTRIFNADNASTSTLQKIRNSFVVRVNRHCCITQCELLLQTVLIGQSV